MQQPPAPWQQQQPGWGLPQQPSPYVPQVPSPPISGEPEVSAIDAIKFLFQDDNWQHNLLIGSVYTLIPVVGQLSLQGWHCEIMQRLARRHPRPIPKLEFSDLTHYLSRGITPFCVSLILMLPLSLVISGLMMIGLFGGGAIAAATGEPAVMIVVYLLMFVVTYAVGLAMGVVFLGAMTRSELSEEIGYSVSPGAVFSYAGKVFWKALLANFIYGLLIGPLMMIGYMLCFIGLYPAMVIIAVGSTNLRWQLYQVYAARGGEAIQLKAAVQLPSEQQLAPQPMPQQPYAQAGQYQQPRQGQYQQPPQGPFGGYPGR
jgi:hypothetical protein